MKNNSKMMGRQEEKDGVGVLPGQQMLIAVSPEKPRGAEPSVSPTNRHLHHEHFYKYLICRSAPAWHRPPAKRLTMQFPKQEHNKSG